MESHLMHSLKYCRAVRLRWQICMHGPKLPHGGPEREHTTRQSMRRHVPLYQCKEQQQQQTVQKKLQFDKIAPRSPTQQHARFQIGILGKANSFSSFGAPSCARHHVVDAADGLLEVSGRTQIQTATPRLRSRANLTTYACAEIPMYCSKELPRSICGMFDVSDNRVLLEICDHNIGGNTIVGKKCAFFLRSEPLC